MFLEREKPVDLALNRDVLTQITAAVNLWPYYQWQRCRERAHLKAGGREGVIQTMI